MASDFSWVTWEEKDIRTAAEAALSAKRIALEAVKAVAAGQRTFENTVAALERSSDDVSDLLQILDVIVNIHTDGHIRDIAQSTVDHLNAELVGMEYDRDLWNAMQEWLKTGEHERMSGPDLKLADDMLRDMRRMGFGLDDASFADLKARTSELKRLENEFEKSINDWDDHIELPRERLGGLPERYIEGLRRTPAGLYIVSLQYPELFPFMELAEDDEARKELAAKNLRKGGEENLERLVNMLRLRQTIAGMLGYRTHADFAEEVRMSGNARTVREFLGHIMAALEPVAHRELAAMVAYKFHSSNAEKPAPVGHHEIAYWTHRMKKDFFGLDSEALKEYFPLARVIEGMLAMYQELLGLTFAPADVPVWHPDVTAYRVTDAASGAELGHFFLDLHPRAGKYGHAAAFPVTLDRRPVVALVCNFPYPTRSNPGLLSHDEVETLLHEFGHCMHAIVSGGPWRRQNGFGVPLDFVEALSQIFEYWAWDERSLARLSGHFQTGKQLPHDLFEKLSATRKFRQPSYYLAQAVRSLYDLDMHDRPTDTPVEASHLAQMYRDMRLVHEHIDLPDDSIFAAGWSHLADYDAGYYGYLWSKVYAADLFTKFFSNPLDSTIGRRYRDTVLAPGASKPEKALVHDFLGRDPSQRAFFVELGIQ